MAKSGSKGNPLILRVADESKAQLVADICFENDWQFILGIEPDQEEDVHQPPKHPGQVAGEAYTTQVGYSRRPADRRERSLVLVSKRLGRGPVHPGSDAPRRVPSGLRRIPSSPSTV